MTNAISFVWSALVTLCCDVFRCAASSSHAVVEDAQQQEWQNWTKVQEEEWADEWTEEDDKQWAEWEKW